MTNVRPLYLLRALAILIAITLGCTASTGCATARVTGKVLVTPVTVVRDVVDAPLVSLTNVFGYFGDVTHVAKAPHAGVSWNPWSGFGVGIGYDLSHILFRAIQYTIGGVDYVVCRSLWPNWARGVSPFRRKGQSWGSLYFPSTRVLWGDERPLYKPPPDPKAEGAPPGS